MGSDSGGTPAGPAVERHHDDVVWVGAGPPAAACPVALASPSEDGPGAAASGPDDPSPAAEPRPAAARRARAWYSGPCLRGSAYSFGLRVQ